MADKPDIDEFELVINIFEKCVKTHDYSRRIGACRLFTTSYIERLLLLSKKYCDKEYRESDRTKNHVMSYDVDHVGDICKELLKQWTGLKSAKH